MSDSTTSLTSTSTSEPTCAHCGDPFAEGENRVRGYHRGCHAARDRLWRSTPEGKSSRALTKAAYRDHHPQKVAAWAAVRAEVERGRMLPARYYACVGCGHRAAEYDHVSGYAPEHWLTVEPVCKRCHGERRRQRGEVRGRLPNRAVNGPVIPEFLREYRSHAAEFAAAWEQQRRGEHSRAASSA